MIGSIRSTWSKALENLARPSTVSTFRTTGELTIDEFVQAGDYLVYKFPTWSWSGGDPKARNDKLPAGKQFLVTKEVPCLRRLDDNFAAGWEGGGTDGDEWGLEGDAVGETSSSGAKIASAKGVKGLDEQGVVEDDEVLDEEDEDEIPDMEDDDDEAIIRDNNNSGKAGGSGTTAPRRQYSLYICYTMYYRTPRIYLSGYDGKTALPLTPDQMMEDIMGDYKDKTVTIEDFPHFEGSVKMASIHPCRHAGVMRVLLDRADASLKSRRKRQLALQAKEKEGMPDVGGLSLGGNSRGDKDEWEEIVAEDEGEGEDAEVAIRVDQYLVVFLKFVASVTPGIEHDFTMGL
ncbi:hypothetical protein L211DRAFT_839642 [Terfezia boudieri ATCC MYA-4762]|uniref:Autophagy-related protein 3 n=1 Tax=Terfezia boudieri ATCC MYA-4762 TaxID=1051890 RepID=A0A3N4LI69_9PEZI|nr:hypothetical protein L211DRAFT_839642 [Terfezia boudieri ATCC MYA-4762]